MLKRLAVPFSIDLRSLALFRVTLGLMLVIDIISRLPNLRAFYSDEGVLPRAVLIERFANPWHVGLLLITGRPLIVTIIFFLGMLLAISLMIGYRSRLAAFLCWLFVISVDSRNPAVIHGGDEVMRLLFFWSWLLPLGARCSIDRALNPEASPSSHSYVSMASAGLILQICFIYWFTAILKIHPVWYREGSAIYYVLNFDILASSFGKWLLHFPTLLEWMTFATLGLELVGPTLIFVPFANGLLRLLACVSFMIFHLGLAMLMHLGTFPWIACIAWSVILPALVWDRLAKSGSRQTDPQKGMKAPEPMFPPSVFHQAFSAAALLLILAWNVAPLRNGNGAGLKSPWWEIGSILQINQRWTLFAPYPTKDDGWYVIDAELFSGERVDPLRDGRPVTFEKPESIATLMKDSMWRKYLMNLWLKAYNPYRLHFGRYLCRTWNTAHSGDQQIKTMHIYFMLETTPPPGDPLPPAEKNLVWRHYCFEQPPDW